MMTHSPAGAGKSSFDLIDERILSRYLTLEKSETLLDAACGPGHYTLFLAGIREPGARIVAADRWWEGIERLARKVAQDSIPAVGVQHADMGSGIGLASGSVDVCLMATVIHDLVEDGTDQEALQEIARVLKPNGRLAAVEFKKIAGPPGPPFSIRLSEEALAKRLGAFGFTQESVSDAGPYLYLTMFRLRVKR